MLTVYCDKRHHIRSAHFRNSITAPPKRKNSVESDATAKETIDAEDNLVIEDSEQEVYDIGSRVVDQTK